MTVAQWAQITAAVALVQHHDHGAVTLVVEDGHPRRLLKTMALLLKAGTGQVGGQVQEKVDDQVGDGSVTVIIRNGRPTRIEITVEELVIAPATRRAT